MSYSGSNSPEDIHKKVAKLQKDKVEWSMVETMTLKILLEHIQDLEEENERLRR